MTCLCSVSQQSSHSVHICTITGVIYNTCWYRDCLLIHIFRLPKIAETTWNCHFINFSYFVKLVVIVQNVWAGKCIRVVRRRWSDRELRIILGWCQTAPTMPAAFRQHWTTMRNILFVWCTDFTNWRRNVSCAMSLSLPKVSVLCVFVISP